MQRPYVILKCATTIDGYIDDATNERLLISSQEDFSRVDEVRAACDAILVGAETIRRDNPRLLIRSPELRAARASSGRAEDPIKVTITRTGDLPESSHFFTTGIAEKVVYCPQQVEKEVERRLEHLCTVHGISSVNDELFLERLLGDLSTRAVSRLLVEGGSRVLGMFLNNDLYDELQLSIGNMLLGGRGGVCAFAQQILREDKRRLLKLKSVEQLGQTALLVYHRS